MILIAAIVFSILTAILFWLSRRPSPEAHQAGLGAILMGVASFLFSLVSVLMLPTLEIKTTKSLEHSVQAIPDYSNIKIVCEGGSNLYNGTLPVQFSYKSASFQVPYKLNKALEHPVGICNLNLQEETSSVVSRLAAIQKKVGQDIEEALAAPEHAVSQSTPYDKYVYNIRKTIKEAERQSQVYVLTPDKQQTNSYSINQKTPNGYVPVPVPKFKTAEPAFTPETISSTQQLLLQNISGQ